MKHLDEFGQNSSTPRETIASIRESSDESSSATKKVPLVRDACSMFPTYVSITWL
jgi:hypothetical protein